MAKDDTTSVRYSLALQQLFPGVQRSNFSDPIADLREAGHNLDFPPYASHLAETFIEAGD